MGKKLLIKTLENELERLELCLEVAEKQELSLEDLNNSKSNYIILDNLRQKYRQTWKKYSLEKNLLNNNIFSMIIITKSSNEHINIKMQEWINNYKQFPSFVDVYQELEKLYKDFKYQNNNIIECEAKEIFLEIGTYLVKSRKSFYKFYFDSYFENCKNNSNIIDPADSDIELNNKLLKNMNEYISALTDVDNYFRGISNINDNFNDSNLETDNSLCESSDLSINNISDTENSQNNSYLSPVLKLNNQNLNNVDFDNKIFNIKLNNKQCSKEKIQICKNSKFFKENGIYNIVGKFSKYDKIHALKSKIQYLNDFIDSKKCHNLSNQNINVIASALKLIESVSKCKTKK